jgi:hypothetical protein
VDICCTKGFFRDRGKEVKVRVGGGKFGMFYCGFLQENDEAVGIGRKGMECGNGSSVSFSAVQQLH